MASREVAPWLAALSTVATNNSGFMHVSPYNHDVFKALPGFLAP